jgi:hypothetical protein
MAKMTTTVEIEKLLEQLELIKKKAKPTLEEQKKAISVTNQTELNLDKIRQFWNKLTQQFRKTKVNLANALECGIPAKLEDSQLIVEFQAVDIFHLNWLNKNKQLVEEELFQTFKKRIKITTKTKQMKNDIDKNENDQNASHHIKDINHASANDPLLNKLIDEFGLELT